MTTEAPTQVGVPTAAQLLEAVQEFLAEDVLTSSSERLRYQGRVAHNILDVLQREFDTALPIRAECQEQLSSLGFSTEAELADHIRGLDDGAPVPTEIWGYVNDAVLADLRISNPGHEW